MRTVYHSINKLQRKNNMDLLYIFVSNFCGVLILATSTYLIYNFATVLSLVLFVTVAISTVSPKCQFWVKHILMFTYFVITALIVILFGLVTRNPTKTCNLWALLNRHRPSTLFIHYSGKKIVEAFGCISSINLVF